MINDAPAKLGIQVEVEKVTDAKSIAMESIMSTPGISVDGKLVRTGGLPDAAKLNGWLDTQAGSTICQRISKTTNGTQRINTDLRLHPLPHPDNVKVDRPASCLPAVVCESQTFKGLAVDLAGL